MVGVLDKKSVVGMAEKRVASKVDKSDDDSVETLVAWTVLM